MNTKSLNVIPVRSGNKPMVWHMSHDGASGGPGHYPKVSVAEKTNSDLVFTIVNPQDITFSTDPIWIQKGAMKPTGGVGAPFSVIGGASSAVLTVHDNNTVAGDYSYVLNFNNAQSLDPIIKNGGGGPGTQHLAWYAIGALVVAALVFLLFRSKRSPDHRAP